MIGPLHMLDWLFLLIFCVFLTLGIMKGLVRELFSLGFLVLGVALAYRFYPSVGKGLRGLFHGRQQAQIAGFLTVFGLVLLLGAIVTWIVKKVLIRGPLQAIDRFFGGALGILRGVLICSVITLLLYKFPFHKDLQKESRLLPKFYSGIRTVSRILPKKIRKGLEVNSDDVQQTNQ